MPEILGKQIDEVEAPSLGVSYTITDIEEFRSTIRSFEGYRVTLQDTPNHQVVETLWKQEVYGPNSKIGAYVAALGKNTDTWKGKKIRYTQWVKGARRIEVLPPSA